MSYNGQRLDPTTSLADRVLFHSVCDVETGCWLWQASLSDGGYGVLRYQGHTYYAHRVSYESFASLIPDGLQVDHVCRVRRCVNPAHLEPVTPQINTLRGESPGARAIRTGLCHKGHPRAEFGVTRGPRTFCRKCLADWQRENRRKQAAKRPAPFVTAKHGRSA